MKGCCWLLACPGLDFTWQSTLAFRMGVFLRAASGGYFLPFQRDGDYVFQKVSCHSRGQVHKGICAPPNTFLIGSAPHEAIQRSQVADRSRLTLKGLSWGRFTQGSNSEGA